VRASVQRAHACASESKSAHSDTKLFPENNFGGEVPCLLTFYRF
jgi:hypothetical protein